jgi:transketolase
VKIVGAHAGISVGPDGATHQAIEDIALMRVMPNLVVLAPCDAHEVRKATLVAAKYDGPVYIRMGRSDTPVVTTSESPFAIGEALWLYHKNDTCQKTVGIVVTGTLAYNALHAAVTLGEKGIGASVLHMGTIKPLDTKSLEQFAAAHAALVTVEEHQMSGGLGSAVAEHLSQLRPTRIIRLGINDQFGQSGEPEELLAHYGLDVSAIVAAGIQAAA